MTALDLHGHGHYQTYIGDRCRCVDCTRAWNVYNQSNKLRHQRGETVSVPRHVVRAHLVALMDQVGATKQGIARAAGYGNNQTVSNALDTSKTRPVPASAARRLMSVTIDSLPDDAQVHGSLAMEQVDRLAGFGLTRHQIASVLGWTSWPGDGQWPKRRTQVGYVRLLQREADRLDSLCEDCDQSAFEGGRWCWTHFKQRARPVPQTGCGTPAGYAAHRRAGETPCRRCKDGHAAARRAA